MTKVKNEAKEEEEEEGRRLVYMSTVQRKQIMEINDIIRQRSNLQIYYSQLTIKHASQSKLE